MELIDQFKYLVGGYYGIVEMDEYDLKVYLLREIEEYIKNFVEQNKIPNYNYKEEAKKIGDELSLKTKLQDSLIVLQKLDAPIEIILLVKKRLKKIKEEEYN